MANTELVVSTYKELVQSVLAYCIPVWGGARKTRFLLLERAQRALIKVMLFKPVRFPTHELHTSQNLLTTRQLYIFNCILNKHRCTSSQTNLMLKRRNDIVFSAPLLRTTFAQKQIIFQLPYIYNKINRKLQIYPKNLKEVKVSVEAWLLSLDYDGTEILIK